MSTSMNLANNGRTIHYGAVIQRNRGQSFFSPHRDEYRWYVFNTELPLHFNMMIYREPRRNMLSICPKTITTL